MNMTHHHNHHHCNQIPNPDPSILLKNYLNQKKPIDAIELFCRVRSNRLHLFNRVPLAVKACASLAWLGFGRSLHAESVTSGCISDVVVGTSLVDMYARSGVILDARKLFDEMPFRNVVTWNAMIGGYFRNGDPMSASMMFEEMPVRSHVTWIEMISGFARSRDLVTARSLFDLVHIDMKNIVTWTVMVDGYASHGEMEAATEIFEMMPERNFFVWSSMISGFCKKGDVNQAKAIFDRIPVKNLVNWNALISGYEQNGLFLESLQAFEKMQSEGTAPDEFTITSVLSACAQSGWLHLGKEIHSIINTREINCNQFVTNALIDMYAKCGDLSSARSIFDKMLHRNCACWNAMISGFAVNGLCREALQFFERMEESSESPDQLTFLSVLSACAHGGFVDEGLSIFYKMKKHSLVPGLKHYGCLVDLLGRSGKLREAYDLIMRMPMEPNDAIRGALLAACRVHSNTEMAELILNEFSEMNSDIDVPYVLISNIYAESDRWEKAERMRLLMEEKGLQKERGWSSLTS